MSNTQKKSKKKIKAWQIVTIIISIVLLGLIVFAVKQVSSIKVGMPVTVAQALKGDITQTVDTSGIIATEETKTYFADVTAKIDTLSVKEGEMVHAGDLLVTYDTSDMEDALKQTELETKISNYGADAVVIGLNDAQQKAAEAAANKTEADQYIAHYSECVGQINDKLNKAAAIQENLATVEAEMAELSKKVESNPDDKDTAKNLKKKTKEREKLAKELKDYDVPGLKSALEACSGDLAEYKSRKATYEATDEVNPATGVQKAQQSATKESANLSKKKAEEKLADAQKGVKADFDGIITEVTAVEGQPAAEGTQLFTVNNSNKVKVSLSVSKFDVVKLQIGQKATIKLNDQEYTGEVTKISRVAKTNQSGSIMIDTDVHIDNPDDNIILGVEAKVSIETANEKGALLVPVTSVNYASDGVFCYAVVDNKIERRSVETGISNDEFIQILSGLKEGDSVVVNITSEMEDGTFVTPMEDQKGKDDKVAVDNKSAKDSGSDSDKETTDADTKDSASSESTADKGTTDEKASNEKDADSKESTDSDTTEKNTADDSAEKTDDTNAE